MPRILVLHKYYGCETGCCGHIVEIDGETVGGFCFLHPYGEDRREFIRNLVAQEVGEEHVKDIDFDHCIVLED